MIKLLRLSVYLFVLFTVLCSALVYQAYRDLQEPLPLLSSEVLELAPGTSFLAVVRQLQNRGLLSNTLAFEWYARLSGRANDIKAGEYLLEPGINSLELLDILIAGRVIRYQVTLLEGWTYQQALNHLQNQQQLQAALDPEKDLWEQLGIEDPLAQHPEGLFYPDTYDYVRGHRDIDILRRAYHRMQNILAAEWQARSVGLPYTSPYELLIMASIVERETGVAEERDRVAGVFVRRLQKNMRLQADPTVAYGVEEPIDRLRRRHLNDVSNLYNTYRHGGLPPTPIALPSRPAIRASLHPRDEDVLYFVARGDGSHVFSATLAEHQRAVRHYQVEQRRSDYRSSPAPLQPEK